MSHLDVLEAQKNGAIIKLLRLALEGTNCPACNALLLGRKTWLCRICKRDLYAENLLDDELKEMILDIKSQLHFRKVAAKRDMWITKLKAR